MIKKYNLKPDNFEMEMYYWLRTREDLNLYIVKYLMDVEGGRAVVLAENNREKIVEKKELFIFDPNSKLFKILMRNSSYRNDTYTKKILVALNYKPEEYMKIEWCPMNSYDSNITDEMFYTEYEKFYERDKEFCGDTMANIKNVIVNGTSNMSVPALYKTVCSQGGMERVTEDQKWKSLFYSIMSKTNVSYTIRTFYKKYLYEFEFSRRHEDDSELFCYKFDDGSNVVIRINPDKYFGTIKMRRNRGINQYYVQFFSWSKENSEWFSEDVLESYKGIFNHHNHVKRKTRSSKANNLIDDPLTREKHSHASNKNLKIDVQKIKGSDLNAKENSENMKLSNKAAMMLLKNTEVNEKSYEEDFAEHETCLEELLNEECNDETLNDSNDNKTDKKIKKEGGMPKKQESSRSKRKMVVLGMKSRKMKEVEDFLIKTGIMEEDCKVNGDNWAFMQFFDYK